MRISNVTCTEASSLCIVLRIESTILILLVLSASITIARTRLSLELNAKSIARAVNAYINYKMLELAKRYQKAHVVRNVLKIHEKLQRVQDNITKELC